jgi:hypothetical protein
MTSVPTAIAGSIGVGTAIVIAIVIIMVATMMTPVRVGYFYARAREVNSLSLGLARGA